MRILILILTVIACGIVNSQEMRKIDFFANTEVSNKLVNMEFKDSNFKGIKAFKDFEKVVDTSFYKSENFKEYGVKHLKNNDTHLLLLLERLEDTNGNATGMSKILNYNEFTLSKEEGVVIGYCGKEEQWDKDEMYAVVYDRVKAKKNEGNISRLIKTIWEINETSFTKVKFDNTFSCFSDTNYLLQLSQK